ncbi:MAG: glycosyltransferase [Alphaproteobacteria bacterium]|nr:glycosyltransferase [Alphaproteobacteria bacterium]
MSLFSIITITRDNMDGLARTAESLAAQTCPDYEWIVVDGASIDGTLEFLKDKPALVVSEPDRGLYDAMNKGIERANGQYLIFMNAGDVFAGDNVLAGLATLLAEAGNPAFLYADSEEEGEKSRIYYKHARSHHMAALGMFTHHQAMVYDRAVLGDLRYDLSYKIAADYDLTLRFLQQNGAGKIVYWPHALCRFEAGGISQQRAQQGRAEQYKIRQALRLVLPPLNMLIYKGQSLSLALRKHMPGLYRALRRDIAR